MMSELEVDIYMSLEEGGLGGERGTYVVATS